MDWRPKMKADFILTSDTLLNVLQSFWQRFREAASAEFEMRWDGPRYPPLTLISGVGSEFSDTLPNQNHADCSVQSCVWTRTSAFLSPHPLFPLRPLFRRTGKQMTPLLSFLGAPLAGPVSTGLLTQAAHSHTPRLHGDQRSCLSSLGAQPAQAGPGVPPVRAGPYTVYTIYHIPTILCRK